MCIICSSMSDKKETLLTLLMVTKTNQYMINIFKKSNPTHFSWPSRVPFDFGKHQVTNFKWVLFAHLFFNCFHLRFVLLFHRQRTQFLTNKKKKIHNSIEAASICNNVKHLIKWTTIFFLERCELLRFYFIG